MLSVQHRMHPHIAEVISNVFYNNKLVTDKDKERKYLTEDFQSVLNLKEESHLTNTPALVWISQPDVQKLKVTEQESIHQSGQTKVNVRQS